MRRKRTRKEGKAGQIYKKKRNCEKEWKRVNNKW